MKHGLISAIGAALIATQAGAGGIDQNGQPIGFIFEERTYLEIGAGSVSPFVSGNDFAIFGGGPSGNIAKPILPFSFSLKTDLTDKLSIGILWDQPFGAEIEYGPGSALFGGTTAVANISALTALVRYKFSDRFSVHGGARIQSGNAEVSLTGAAYGGLSGYNVTLSNDTAVGYVAGVAYEIPEYFLRVALTYNSEIKHEFATVESVGGFVVSTAPSQAKTPQSVNLDFRTGIAPGTFIFGGARWVDWSELAFDPPFLFSMAGEGIVSFEDTTTYSLGVGRQFNDNWTGLFSVIYEPEGNPLVSPLAPTNGFVGASLGLVYSRDNMRISGGVNYTKLGDAMPEIGTPDTAVATFTDNHSVGVGLRLGFSF